MMLSIKTVLELPIFAEARLVGGAGGADRNVRHVHVVDLPDPAFQWAEGGELMLTTGYSLPGSASAQQQYVDRLHGLNLAGLVISIGHYMQHIPAPIIAAANRCDFPVIELPSSVSFAHVTRELMGHIIDTQHSITKRSDEIRRTLMDLVLNGATLQAVADVVAELLGRSITIESQSFEVLATAQVGEVDRARERSVKLGQTSAALAEDLIQRGIYKKLLEKRGPVYVAPIAEIGMSKERIVAPIIVANQITGFVWIIAGEQRLNELDELAIETASLITALVMMRERSLREKERNLRGDLFSRLLNKPDASDPDLIDLAYHSGFQMHLTYQVLAIQARDKNGATIDIDRLQRRIEQQLDQRKLIVQREQTVLVLLQAHQQPDGARVARDIYDKFAHPTLSLRVGVGTIAPIMHAIRSSFESAMEVLDITQAFGIDDGVQTHDDMGLLLWLKHIPPTVLLRNRFYRDVITLYEQNPDLYRTLCVYLAQDKNSGVTARQLDIHRNTLAHRLQRIERILSCSLEEADICLNFHTALTAHRLYRD